MKNFFQWLLFIPLILASFVLTAIAIMFATLCLLVGVFVGIPLLLVIGGVIANYESLSQHVKGDRND